MPLLTIIIVLVAVGIILWAINKWVPMEGNIKNILNIVIILVVVLWLLKALGILSALGSVTV